MQIIVTFQIWCAAIDVYLDRLQCPRVLADMPAELDIALQTWFTYGVRAEIVARALTAIRWPNRVTFDADPLVPVNARRIALELAA